MKKIKTSILIIFFLGTCAFFVNAQTMNSLTYRFGVKKLSVVLNNDGSKIITLDAKQNTLNGFSIDLYGTVLVFKSDGENNTISYTSLKSNDITGVKHNLLSKDFFLFYNQYSCNLNQINNVRLTEEGEIAYMVLLNILKEIEIHPDASVIEITDFVNPDFKKLYRECIEDILTIGGSRSMAESRASSITAKFLKNHPDCKKAGGIDVSCLWENHACFASQFFECNGNTCNPSPTTWCWDCGPKFL